MPPCFSAAGSALGRGEVGSSALLGFLLEGLVSSPSGWGEGLLPAQPGVCVCVGGLKLDQPPTHPQAGPHPAYPVPWLKRGQRPVPLRVPYFHSLSLR